MVALIVRGKNCVRKTTCLQLNTQFVRCKYTKIIAQYIIREVTHVNICINHFIIENDAAFIIIIIVNVQRECLQEFYPGGVY